MIPKVDEKPLLTSIENEQNVSFSSYESSDLTKYLTESERKTLSDLLEKIPQQEVDSVVNELQRPDGMFALTNKQDRTKNTCLSGLKAFQQGKLTEYQVATLGILHSVVQQMIQDPKRYHLITKNGDLHIKPVEMKILEEDRELMKQDLRWHSLMPSDEGQLFVLKQFFAATDEIKKILEDISNELPVSEQGFWLCTLPAGPAASWSPLHHRINTTSPSFFRLISIYKIYNGEAFLGVKPQQLLIPSFGLMQKVLQRMLPESTVQIFPTFGMLKKEDIIDCKLHGKRPVNVACPGIFLPKEADGYPTGGDWSFTLHDFYHWLRDRTTPKGPMDGIVRINNLIREMLSHPNHKDHEQLKSLQWDLCDGELFDADLSNGVAEPVKRVLAKFRWPSSLISVIHSDMEAQPTMWNTFLISKEDFPKV